MKQDRWKDWITMRHWPSGKTNLIQLTLIVAISRGWKILQLDISNVFLNESWEERIVMNQLVGFIEAGKESWVCRLKKSIYGFKKSSRQWFIRIKEFLVSYGFKGSEVEPLLFYLIGDYTRYILIYIDDMIVTDSNQERVNALLSSMGNEFVVREVGTLVYFLGINVK